MNASGSPTLLNLPHWTVLGFKESRHDYEIEATYQRMPEVCPQCGVVHPQLYRFGAKEQLIMDVPMHGKRVGLLIHRQKYRCRECMRTFYERIPDLDEKRLMTSRLVAFIQRESLKRTFVSVADDVGVDEKTVRNIFHKYSEELNQQSKISAPEWLGIDEVSVDGAMRCILTDMKHHAILDLLKDRRKRTVLSYLRDLPKHDSIQIVTMDMWDAYRLAVRQVLPKAKIVVDKFHVVRMANQSLETVRKAIRASLSEKQRKTLMHDRFILLHRRTDLDASKLLILESWTKNLPLLSAAYELKESFFDIWLAPDRNQALASYQEWQQRIPENLQSAFQPLITAMTNWQAEIFNYFDDLVTNAYTETANGMIKAMIRNCRGASFDVVRAKMRFRGQQSQRPKFGVSF